MGKKTVSYQQLLKEAISEFDTSKNVDVKGPMLDPILSYEGDGELPTYKDAASILERYYFNETRDKGVEIATEADYENDKGNKDKTASKHTEGPGGEEQAGTSDAATIPASKDEKGKDIAKEDVDADADSKTVVEDKKGDADVEDEKTDEADLSEDVENAVIEKLIAEMEDEDEKDEEDDDDKDEKEEVKESDGNPKSDFKDPPDAPDEKKAKGPMEDTEGAGTEQAGTGTSAGQVPNRKDRADQMVKPKNYSEGEESVKEQDEDVPEKDDEKEEKDLDVDKEIKEDVVKETPGGGSGTGHVPPPHNQDKMGGEGEGDDELEESLEEAFELFKEEIEKE